MTHRWLQQHYGDAERCALCHLMRRALPIRGAVNIQHRPEPSDYEYFINGRWQVMLWTPRCDGEDNAVLQHDERRGPYTREARS